MNSTPWIYQIDGEVGRGTSGVVLSAITPQDEKVAIKVFDSRKGSKESDVIVKFLEAEFGIVQSLDHPHIVKYIEWGMQEGSPYLVIKPLASETLEQRIERKQGLSPQEVAALLTQIADALDYLHAHSILHRDVKPSNILFDSSGVSFLSDFGIAHQIPSRPGTFPEGAQFIPGTPDFMAPEVMEGAPPSPASDIYSLALTIYYALCQRLPSDSNSLHRRNVDRIEGKLVKLIDRQPALHVSVSDAVMQGLNPDPKERYSSAASFAAAFSLALTGGPGNLMSKHPKDQEALQPVKVSWLGHWKVLATIITAIATLITAIAALIAALLKE